jgi:epoxyqueuosine reductase QueG
MNCSHQNARQVSNGTTYCPDCKLYSDEWIDVNEEIHLYRIEKAVAKAKEEYRDSLKEKIEKIDEGLCMDCCDSSRVKKEVLALLDQEREDK